MEGLGLAFPLVENYKLRKFGNREKVRVGIDTWVPSGCLSKLPDNMNASPQRKGIPNLAQATLQICPLFDTKSGKMQIN